METPFNVQLRLPPMPQYARSARAALAAFASYHCLAERDVEGLTFALGEALANAIAHGCTNDDIEVGFRIDDKAIVATVRDRGRGFADTARVRGAARAQLPTETSEIGRGFAIMQLCTDFLDVRSEPGAGTTVTLGRYRTNRQEAAPDR